MVKVLPHTPVKSKLVSVHQKRSVNTPSSTLPKSSVRFGATLLQDLPYVLDFSAPVVPQSVHAAGEVLQAMALKKKLTKDSGSIKLVINSPGGSVTEGFKLIGLIKQLDTPIDTVVMGIAASMGAVLSLAAASKGRRFMDRYAKIMIHQPSAGGIQGTSEEINVYSQEINRTRNTVDGLISQHTGLPIAKVREMTSKDTFIAPLRALKDGFVDWVLIAGDKGLNKDSIKNLKDDDIARRDEFNQYDDLPMFTIDPKSSAPQVSSGRGGGGLLGGGGGGGYGPTNTNIISIRPAKPSQKPSKPEQPGNSQATTKLSDTTEGLSSITRVNAPEDPSSGYRPKLEIYA